MALEYQHHILQFWIFWNNPPPYYYCSSTSIVVLVGRGLNQNILKNADFLLPFDVKNPFTKFQGRLYSKTPLLRPKKQKFSLFTVFWRIFDQFCGYKARILLVRHEYMYWVDSRYICNWSLCPPLSPSQHLSLITRPLLPPSPIESINHPYDGNIV